MAYMLHLRDSWISGKIDRVLTIFLRFRDLTRLNWMKSKCLDNSYSFP